MSFSHEYNVPFFIATGAMLKQGDTSDLKAGQLALINNKDYKVVQGTLPVHQDVRIAQGSWHTKDKLNKFWGGLQESQKTINFLGKDVFEFHRSAPRRAQNEEWVIGWDGLNDCDTLNYECGKTYTYKVRVWGEDVYGTFLRPIDRFISIHTGCCPEDGCTDTCENGVPCKTHAKKLAETINNDPELQYFVQAEAISSDVVAKTPTHRLYELTVCDTGDVQALADVQIQYPLYNIERISRQGSLSTYQFCTPIAGGAAATATLTTGTVTGVNVTNGGAGYLGPVTVTFTGGGGTGATGTAVVTNGRVTGVTINTAGTGYTTAPTIAFVGVTAPADFVPVGEILLTECEDCPSGYTEVPATDVYVINRALAGTENLTTDASKQTFADLVGDAYDALEAKFLSHNGAVAAIQIQVPENEEVTAVLADLVNQVASKPARCLPEDGEAIAWLQGDDRYKITRTLCLPLKKICGTDNRLAELQAFYANHKNIVPGSVILRTAGTCDDLYQIQQYNNDCLVDGCLTEDIAEFDTVQSFDGYAWNEACPCDAGASDPETLCGVRIRTAYEDTRFGGCSFHPADYYSVRPLKVEIFEFDDSGNPCANNVPSRKTQNSSMATQTGEHVIREFINANKYRAYGEFYSDPRTREVMDAEMHNLVDRNAFYNIYYLKVKQNRGYLNGQGDYAPEIFEFRFAFKEGVDATDFENTIQNFTSQFGINLQDR